jgi:hypothetical protein
MVYYYMMRPFLNGDAITIIWTQCMQIVCWANAQSANNYIMCKNAYAKIFEHNTVTRGSLCRYSKKWFRYMKFALQFNNSTSSEYDGSSTGSFHSFAQATWPAIVQIGNSKNTAVSAPLRHATKTLHTRESR